MVGSGFELSQGYSLKYLGNLFHLRYLGLCGTGIAHLPKEIGNMQYLQTLDVTGNKISSLPPSIVQLRNLMSLHIDWSTKVPTGIGNLTCLEKLLVRIDNSNIDIIEELGQLTELKVLRIVLNEWNDKLVECLWKLQKIHNIYIEVIQGERRIGGLDDWVAPIHLCRLKTLRSCWFSTLPDWMDASQFSDLCVLSIAVRELQQDDLEILGRLPALRRLDLEVDHENLGILRKLVVGAYSFLCLVSWELSGFLGPVVFRQGAMPRLTSIWLCPFSLWEVRQIDGINAGLDLGLGNLLLLQLITVDLQSKGISKEEVEEAEAALWHATAMHTNHPRLSII